jgi:hypothetical protein
VLLSRATEQLVREQLPPDAALRDLGTHRLKDLSLPEQIFQLLAPDLPAAFAALNTLDARRTNLPAQPTPLIGRAYELAQAGALLHQPEARLLTLTGPGGIGKTRLALELAGTVLEQFPDGVWLVELAPLADPALIVPAIAAVLELRADPGRPLLTTLTTYLRERQPLLILDNCEHLIDACAQVSATLVQACPRLRLLASSREPLGIAGETSIRVPPLAVPDPHEQLPPDQLMQYEAVQLFVERALAVQPSFRVRPIVYDAGTPRTFSRWPRPRRNSMNRVDSHGLSSWWRNTTTCVRRCSGLWNNQLGTSRCGSPGPWAGSGTRAPIGTKGALLHGYGSTRAGRCRAGDGTV